MGISTQLGHPAAREEGHVALGQRAGSPMLTAAHPRREGSEGGDLSPLGRGLSQARGQSLKAGSSLFALLYSHDP